MRIPAAIFALATVSIVSFAQDGPQPRVVDPGGPAAPPSDAVVLFDGKDNSGWTHQNGSPVKWPVIDGALICKSGTGNVVSKRKFGSAQIHVEFSTPNMPEQKGQMRGNSGVYIQGHYEIQVLDSYKNPTYANGSCGALYGQYAPLVNACRPPGQWQTYDIVFHAPKCSDGKVTEPGTLTILHNGVLIQDHITIKGPSDGGDNSTTVCEPGVLMLQDHYDPKVRDTPLRYRNIWFRPLD